jgi:benzoate-CoA ligase
VLTHSHARLVIASDGVFSIVGQSLADAGLDDCVLIASRPQDEDLVSRQVLSKLIEVAPAGFQPVPRSCDDIAF